MAREKRANTNTIDRHTILLPNYILLFKQPIFWKSHTWKVSWEKGLEDCWSEVTTNLLPPPSPPALKGHYSADYSCANILNIVRLWNRITNIE